MELLKPPYPWMGGKAKITAEVWRRFGDVDCYVEPFFGGGAVLLAAPWPDNRTETVNDINAHLVNIWRALKADPDAVAYHASDLVSELDLHARGDWLFYRPDAAEFVEKVRSDPDFYDVKSAGWWVWGQSSWIGDNWGRRECRSLPHLGNAGMDADDPTDTTRRQGMREYFHQLCERLARVRVCCGDWTRVLGPCVTTVHGMTGVFLDPPYGVEDRADCYGEHDSRTVAQDVLKWCLENGDNPLLRIALCGYENEHNELENHGWDVFVWKANGGYSNFRKDKSNQNKSRERIWFNHQCLKVDLFDNEK